MNSVENIVTTGDFVAISPFVMALLKDVFHYEGRLQMGRCQLIANCNWIYIFCVYRLFGKTLQKTYMFY